MKKELSLIGIALSILLVATTASSVIAQNYSKNASNAVGNASASIFFRSWTEYVHRCR
jgi:hypothetical protein